MMGRRTAQPDLAGNPYEQVGTCPITKLPIRRWHAERDLRLIGELLARLTDAEEMWAHEPLQRRRAQLSAMLEASR